MYKKMNEQGFTLVELAVVMIVIGLLIGGILKGQELVANAEVNATVAQIKSIDAAALTFRDKYGAYPGDMPNAQNRIAGLGAGNNGDGNGRITNIIGPASGAGFSEARFFWNQLQSAEMIGGTINGNTLESKFKEAFIAVGWWGGGNQPPLQGPGIGNGWKGGHYLSITSDNMGLVQNDIMTPVRAGQIDRKLDDGSPSTGNIRGAGGGACMFSLQRYDERLNANSCALYIRMQS